MQQKVNFFLVFLLSILIPVAYIPDVYQNKIYYTIFSTIATLVLGFAFMLSFVYSHLFRRESFPKLLKVLILYIFILLVEFLVFYIGNLNINIQDLVSIIAIGMGIYVGFVNNLSIYQIKIIVIAYCIFAIVSGYLSISTYSSFTVYAVDYLVEGKNQIGQIISLCSVLSFILVYFESKKKIKFLMCCVCALSIFFLLVIKCKTAIFATMIVLVLLSFKLGSIDAVRKKLIIGVPLIILALNIFGETILDIVGLSGKTLSMEEFTTGRSERNYMAIKYILDNPISGELESYSYIPLIHNWVLLRLVRLGLVFSLPFILFYFYVLFYAVKQILKNKNWSFDKMGIFLIIVPYISSLAEPSAPFAPNTIYVMHYILLGVSLRKIKSANLIRCVGL